MGSEIFAAHRVMLAADHAAEARKVAFSQICMDAILTIGLGVVDPSQLESVR
jgi:hypothetical protein